MKKIITLAALALTLSPALAKHDGSQPVLALMDAPADTVPAHAPSQALLPVEPAPTLTPQPSMPSLPSVVVTDEPSMAIAPAPTPGQPALIEADLDAKWQEAFPTPHQSSGPIIEEIEDEDEGVAIITAPTEEVFVTVTDTPEEVVTEFVAPDFRQFGFFSNRTMLALIADTLGYTARSYENQYGHILKIGSFPGGTDAWGKLWRTATPEAQALVTPLMQALAQHKQSESENFLNETGKVNRHDMEDVALAAYSLPYPLFKYVTNKMGWGMRQFRLCNERQAEYKFGYDFEHFEPRFRHSFVKMKRGKQVAIQRLILAVAAFYNAKYNEYPFSITTVGKLGELQMMANSHWHPLS